MEASLCAVLGSLHALVGRHYAVEVGYHFFTLTPNRVEVAVAALTYRDSVRLNTIASGAAITLTGARLGGLLGSQPSDFGSALNLSEYEVEEGAGGGEGGEVHCLVVFHTVSMTLLGD
jgi:hypothetical protein